MSITPIKTKKCFGFASENLKVEWYDPYIQAFDEYGYLKNEKGIMHYYYHVDIFEKISCTEKWRKLFTISTYDFPAIRHFKRELERFLNKEIKIEDYQQTKVDKHASYYYTTGRPSLCEDAYTLTHSFLIKKDGKRILDECRITIGKSYDYRSESAIDVTFNNLTEEDLKIIYNVIKDFIDFSINENNRIVYERNFKNINKWKIENSRLYEMTGEFIDNIYQVNDEIEDITVLVNSLNSQNYYSTQYHDFTIKSIQDGCIMFDNGKYQENGKWYNVDSLVSIPINTILDIFVDMPEEKLKYNEEQIKDDFISILTPEEKAEFKTQNLDYLFNKYCEAILNRTWMCRDEHNLPKRVEDTGNHENVYESIRAIIKNIKEAD